MTGETTEAFRSAAEPAWSEATTHPFTERLGEGSLADAVFREYLIQDYAFLDALASLVGYAVAQAPRYAAKQRFSGFLATITDEESDYFERSFDALGVPEDRWQQPKLASTTQRFRDLCYRAGARGGYAETLAVLVPVEWVYSTWASAATDTRPEAFYFAEWIELHDTPAFHETVDWLRSELDRACESTSSSRTETVQSLFERAVDLEVEFFDTAFDLSGVSLDG